MRSLDDILGRPGEVPNLDAILDRATESDLSRKARELCEAADRLKESTQAAITSVQGFKTKIGIIKNLRDDPEERSRDTKTFDFEHFQTGHTFQIACWEPYLPKFIQNPYGPEEEEFHQGLRKAWNTKSGERVYYNIPIRFWKVDLIQFTADVQKFTLRHPETGWMAWGYSSEEKIMRLHKEGRLVLVKGQLQEIRDEEGYLVNGRLFNNLGDYLSPTTP